MLEKARYIVVEGPIGAGKTTLAKRLAERINADVLLENPAANPFLGRFYQNMERWGLPTQIAFLFQRSEQLLGFSQHHAPTTRWQGTMIDSGLRPTAAPMARAACGRSSCCASAPYRVVAP